MITIASWNVNSIKTRIHHLTEWLKEYEPDIVLLQELKCMEEQIPSMEIEDLGYNIVACGQKTYNGVAILSKFPIEDIVSYLPGDSADQQARYIEGLITINNKVLRVASVYVPNGSDPDSDKFIYKLHFFDRLYNYLKQLLSFQEIMIIGGDFNVAPTSIDNYDPIKLEGTICNHKKERSKWRALLNLGFRDALRTYNSNSIQYTWWDYRGGSWQKDHGMRIDHLLLSPEAANMLEDIGVNTKTRGKEKPSDHAPIWCKLA